MQQNSQLDLAFNFVQYTDRNIFLTGKAGTGKTTFLHELKKKSYKRMVVVAPTGVAAINAGGVTINSFFQLPFGPYIPGNQSNTQHKRFNKDKINLIKSLDLLVIDEISMVRADTLDQIDEVLRRFKNHTKAFGGVQLLMIGDLHQLSPVVKDDDWKILKDYYSNLFFFSSKALAKTEPISIELKHIYRQADSQFIDLLNRVRKNQIDEEVLRTLNQRYIPNFKPHDDEGYITLTTHNKSAQEINENKLKELNSRSFIFHAQIQDDFPEYSYPTVPELELKKGAQVMFIKNDPSRDRLFFNGKIGIITSLSDDHILVKCQGDEAEITVSQQEWTNIKYELDPESKEVKEKIIGTFTQYPLKLAWAITIHKSQGLTFEKAVIDANLAFAHGQVYVALSRCKSFEGMVLSSPISFNSVKTDGTVSEYSKNASNNEPDEKQLAESRKSFQQNLLFELFEFNNLKSGLYQVKKLGEDHHNILDPAFLNDLEQIRVIAEKEIYEVAATFRKHLTVYLQQNKLPEENEELQERIKKACNYFTAKIDTVFIHPLKNLNTDTDNKAVKTNLHSAMENIHKELSIKLSLMKACSNGFSTAEYLRTKANADIDHSPAKIRGQESERIASSIPHPELYKELRSWRDEKAAEWGVPVYMILAQKSILEILSNLPSDSIELESVKGLGKLKIKKYGNEILEIVNAYCKEYAIERTAPAIPLKEKKEKPDTRRVSFDLFKAGKSIKEIAIERGLTTGTIENHLIQYIASGEISIFDLVPKLKTAIIIKHIVENPGSGTNELKSALGDAVSYADIRAVQQHLTYIRSESLPDS
jgi:tRNA uridine 5-carbamoylmethylation protein Kti12